MIREEQVCIASVRVYEGVGCMKRDTVKAYTKKNKHKCKDLVLLIKGTPGILLYFSHLAISDRTIGTEGRLNVFTTYTHE